MPTAAFDLESHPIHLGRGGRAETLPAFDGTAAWYAAYEARFAMDGADGRLVSVFEFTSDWPHWEMHPAGDELVVILEGAMTLVQRVEGGDRLVEMARGATAINPRGVWHTARVAGSCRAMFVTAGLGTRHGTPA